MKSTSSLTHPHKKKILTTQHANIRLQSASNRQPARVAELADEVLVSITDVANPLPLKRTYVHLAPKQRF